VTILFGCAAVMIAVLGGFMETEGDARAADYSMAAIFGVLATVIETCG
jgi:hypothetical protein